MKPSENFTGTEMIHWFVKAVCTHQIPEDEVETWREKAIEELNAVDVKLIARHTVDVQSASAQELYEAYCASSGGTNFNGEPCPSWDDLPTKICDHWQAVAVAALDATTAMESAPAEDADATPLSPSREVGE